MSASPEIAETREAFEAWVKQHDFDLDFEDDDFVRAAWEAWQAAHARLAARIGELEREAKLREDAERWRAFFSSDRFYVMGCSGFDYPSGAVKADHDPAQNWLHFTLNVWDHHPAGDDAQGRHGRAVLLAYVDYRRTVLQQGAPTNG